MNIATRLAKTPAASMIVTMQSEFVIQTHQGCGALHYDFMLRNGDVLVTWRIDQPAADLEIGDSMDALQIPSHRLAYLQYEGPLSGGRGRVSIADAGLYELISQTADRWVIRLSGKSVNGPFEIKRTSQQSDHWTLIRLHQSEE